MKIYARHVIAGVGLIALSAAAPVYAQSDDTVTKVPFEFTAGDASLPRDTYHVTKMFPQTNVLLIRGLHGSAIVVTQPEGQGKTDTAPELVFHRYGDRYFLREIRLPDNAGFSIPESRQERDAAERIASAAGRPDVVVVQSGAQESAVGAGAR